jgi:glycosyltransferase involved in cell wall biosynthesis
MATCSIIIPTYNRKKFEKLIEQNIIYQTYPYILEVLIADDGDESEKLNITIPYPIQYIQCKRMTIGEKRNLLVSKARGTVIAHFDTDDIYFPQYINYAIETMISQQKNAVGTSDMLFLFKDGFAGSMRNPLLSMANEATLVYKKSFWKEGKFNASQSGEGIDFLKGRHWEIGHLDITNVMICLCHESNTVDKSIWKSQKQVILPNYDSHKQIVKELGFNL